MRTFDFWFKFEAFEVEMQEYAGIMEKECSLKE